MRVAAPNRFKLDWVRKNFSHQIEALAAEWFERPVQVQFELPSHGATPRMPVAPVRPAATQGAAPTGRAPPAAAPPPAMVAQTAAASNAAAAVNADAANIVYERSRLNTDLTFENFVTGKANQLARAAALQVAENPGTSYNPLFLYGGVGLGKTHLIHAIGNAMVAAGTGACATCMPTNTCPTWSRPTSARRSTISSATTIRWTCSDRRHPVLLRQEPHAGRVLLRLRGDGGAAQADHHHQRHLSEGTVGHRQPPDLALRFRPDGGDRAARVGNAGGDPAAQGRVRGRAHAEEVAFFIAKHLRSNVRELEGALRKVLAYARFHGRDVLTVDVCKEALKDLLSVSNGQITVENIQKTVADFYKIKVADMYSKRRPANIALPRQVAMYLAKELTQKSLPEIGDLFGGRDHTTVLHAVRKIPTPAPSKRNSTIPCTCWNKL